MAKNINSAITLDATALNAATATPEPDSLSSSIGSSGPVDLRNIQVDGEAAESFIAEKRIGERIKHLRLKKSMGLVELGRHTGLSASFLSQLETGRVVPTLRNLARIAMVFSKDLSYFFDPEPQTLFRLHRRVERVRLPQTTPHTSLKAWAIWFPTVSLTLTSQSFFLKKRDVRLVRISTLDASSFIF